MIYHLFQYLESAGYDFPGMGLMNYLSFRAMLSAVTAVLMALFAGNKIIDWLRSKQIGETVRDLGLDGQIQKKGTPTMGGIIIILSILSGVLLFCDLSNIYIILLTRCSSTVRKACRRRGNWRDRSCWASWWASRSG